MKKLKILYWAVTAVFIYWMYDPTISSAFSYDYAVEFFTKRLGFPQYFLVFTGVTKLVGLVVLLIPGFPKIKEWVYAGLTFDLLGALYCLLAIGMPVKSLWPQTLALILLTASYVFFQLIKNPDFNFNEISDGNNHKQSVADNI
jgi:hypothetical protein